jgi:hypothetical protein
MNGTLAGDEEIRATLNSFQLHCVAYRSVIFRMD